MARALQLAAAHRTHPNPRVGAVVVTPQGSVVGEGSHTGPGSDHAETLAIRQAGPEARGSALVVTLEPCAHHGRTPPCVDAIIGAGITRVIVGAGDPDERVSGKGIEALLAAGIEVEMSDEPASAEAVDPGYFHHRRTGLPRVTLKYAATLDGSVAASDGSSQWITSPESREDAHLLRSEVDAVVIGAGTLRHDDPLLNVRLEGYDGPQPRPIVVAGQSPLPENARLLHSRPVLIRTHSGPDWEGAESVVVDGDALPDPVAAARAIADLGYLDVLIEGGPTLASAWWGAGLVSRGIVYIGSKIGGGRGLSPLAGDFAHITNASDVDIVDVRRVGSDVRIEFH